MIPTCTTQDTLSDDQNNSRREKLFSALYRFLKNEPQGGAVIDKNC